MIGAVILGAGFARRFGSDKRLHPLEDSSVARTTLSLYQKVFDRVRLVVRTDDQALREHVTDLNIEIATTDEAIHGMGHSLRAGMHDLDWPYAFVGLLDMPFIKLATLQRLKDAASETPDHIIRPYLDTPTEENSGPSRKSHTGPDWGHPIGFPAELFDKFAALQGDQGARVLLKQHAKMIRHFATLDRGIVADIDAPEDVAFSG